ncbi:unnamed protein product [Mytilus coruscus]|uniref:Uncharacterized protein n=1 Tax=Mytilus coruscus TaxID=42192 RepID=A0A6J8B6X5_MYTCO|nr:unnamed protein product [Mytilus coruscus]
MSRPDVLECCRGRGVENGTASFNSLSLSAMKTIKNNDKPNLVKDFVKCLGNNKTEKTGTTDIALNTKGNYRNCSMYKDLLKSIKNDFFTYLKNLFKKKRTAASHVLVIAILDERRNKKPYPLPIHYIPYKSLRDQQVRDLTIPIKKAMTEAGMKVVGTVTDGEFNSLRSQGDTGPLHIWQLIHDCRERHSSKMKQESSDFTCYLYVPEVYPATNTIHYERGDHNHILKPIATSTRGCKNASLDPEAFDKAMMDKNTGLTHASLTGQRSQSVEDAEKLYQVAVSMEQNNFDKEAEYVRTIAGWHEASDGRDLSQLQRSKFNYQMLNYIIDDFIP